MCVVDVDYTAEPGRLAHAGSRRRGWVSATADDVSLSVCVLAVSCDL